MSSKYNVHITEYAFKQMEDIKTYIMNELLAPQAAFDLLTDLKKQRHHWTVYLNAIL